MKFNVISMEEWSELPLAEVRKRFFCCGCGKDTHDEYYSVHDEVWLQAAPDIFAGMLCFDCIEKQLGRRLTLADFNDAPINEKHKKNPRFW